MKTTGMVLLIGMLVSASSKRLGSVYLTLRGRAEKLNFTGDL